MQTTRGYNKQPICSECNAGTFNKHSLFIVGDKVKFEWNPIQDGKHNVIKMESEDDFDNCKVTEA